MEALITSARKEFHRDLFELGILTRSDAGVLSNADRSSALSKTIAAAVADQLVDEGGYVFNTLEKLSGQTLGKEFEKAVMRFVERTFPQLQNLRPGYWTVVQLGNNARLKTSDFAQYEHLAYLNELTKANHELKASLGNDYVVAPDVVVYRGLCNDEEINAEREIVDEDYATRADLRWMDDGRKPILHGLSLMERGGASRGIVSGESRPRGSPFLVLGCFLSCPWRARMAGTDDKRKPSGGKAAMTPSTGSSSRGAGGTSSSSALPHQKAVPGVRHRATTGTRPQDKPQDRLKAHAARPASKNGAKSQAKAKTSGGKTREPVKRSAQGKTPAGKPAAAGKTAKGKAPTKKPATKKPATKKPATKKPATKKPATKKRPGKKPGSKGNKSTLLAERVNKACDYMFVSHDPRPAKVVERENLPKWWEMSQADRFHAYAKELKLNEDTFPGANEGVRTLSILLRVLVAWGVFLVLDIAMPRVATVAASGGLVVFAVVSDWLVGAISVVFAVLSVALVMLVIIYEALHVKRMRSYERDCLPNDLDAIILKSRVVRTLSIPAQQADLNEKGASLKDGKSMSLDDRMRAKAIRYLRRMRINVNTRMATDDDSIEKTYRVLVKLPFQQKAIDDLQGMLKGIDECMNRLKKGEVTFSSQMVSADRHSVKYHDTVVVPDRYNHAAAVDSNGEAHDDSKIQSSFPLSLFTDRQSEIDAKAESARKWASKSNKVIHELLTTMGIDCTPAGMSVGATSAKFTYRLAMRLDRNMKDAVPEVMDKNFQTNGSTCDVVARIMSVTVPIPQRYAKPINIPTLYREAFGQGNFGKFNAEVGQATKRQVAARAKNG